MISKQVFLLILSLAGVVLLIFSFKYKGSIDKGKDRLEGIYAEEKNKEEPKEGKKNKQQIALESLLINHNPVLKFLVLLDKNIKVKFLAIFSLSIIYYLFNRESSINDLAIGIIVILALTILIPSILANSILKSKIKRVMADFPGFIDLVAVNVQTGITIDASLKQVAADFRRLNPDLTYIMLRVTRKAELTGLGSALQELAISLPTTEIRMFCAVLQQSLNFGSSIYPQLIQLSSDIREIQLLIIEEKLGTLSAKMSIPLILFIMFPIIILILAPGVMRVFPNV